MKWSTACPDWRQRIVAGKSLVPVTPLFPDEAAAALDVFNALRIVDVGGSPTFGETARDWITDFVAAIFGAYDPIAARRVINEFFLLISKKNSKSTLAAGIMVTALLRNWRESAEFIILAPTLEIAENSSKPAMDMVKADPELQAILKPIPHLRTIEHRTTGARLKIVAADSETVGGKKASGVLIDELWLFGKKSGAEDMLREARGGLASRPEGFVIALSTQSNEAPAGVFRDWLTRYRDIRDGKLIEPSSLGLLYEFPEEMIKSGAYKKHENFYITNPNLGASVDEQFLLTEFQKESRKGPKSLVGFCAKHLDVEVGVLVRSDAWRGADHWEKGAGEKITLDEIIARCEVVVVGLDGGGLDDLYGLTVVGREKQEIEILEPEPKVPGQEQATEENPEAEPKLVKKKIKRWLSWSHAWCHEGVLTLRQTIATVLLGFQELGDLTIYQVPGEDVAGIVEVVKKLKDANLLYCVAVDPAGLGEMIDALAEIQVTAENKEFESNFVIGVPQGYAMMNAIKTSERKLANGTLIHADQPLMGWCVGNLKIEPTATAIRATKQNVGDAKIDPAMALFDAVTVMSMNPDRRRSVYEDRGLRIF